MGELIPLPREHKKVNCHVCRKLRFELERSHVLACCGEAFNVCRDVCAEKILRACGGMTVEEYCAFYERIHSIVCKGK